MVFDSKLMVFESLRREPRAMIIITTKMAKTTTSTTIIAASMISILAKIANQHTSLTNDAGYAIITGAIPRTIDVEKQTYNYPHIEIMLFKSL